MLTNVVLPAPLLPIRLTRSPASNATVTSPAATTAPKRLFSPLATRSDTCASVVAPRRPQRADAARQEADHEQEEESESELPRVREVRARERPHDLEHRARDEHRDDALPAGEDRDEDELARRRPVAEVRLDVAEREDDERAADAGAERRDDEVDRHRAPSRGAEVLDAQLVLAHRERDEAARAVERGPHRDRGRRRDADREQVEQIADAL